MARQFGEKYKNLISKNPNQKSEFNINPGIEQGLLRTKNPYTDLIKKWDFTRTTPSAPFIGRKHREEVIDIYYVYDGYVLDDYIEVQQDVIFYPYYT